MDEPQFGRQLWDWISVEKLGAKRLKMLCWGCVETEEVIKVGERFEGYLKFLRDHRKCIEMRK